MIKKLISKSRCFPLKFIKVNGDCRKRRADQVIYGKPGPRTYQTCHTEESVQFPYLNPQREAHLMLRWWWPRQPVIYNRVRIKGPTGRERLTRLGSSAQSLLLTRTTPIAICAFIQWSTWTCFPSVHPFVHVAPILTVTSTASSHSESSVSSGPAAACRAAGAAAAMFALDLVASTSVSRVQQLRTL